MRIIEWAQITACLALAVFLIGTLPESKVLIRNYAKHITCEK